MELQRPLGGFSQQGWLPGAPYPVWQGPPRRHALAEVPKDSDDNHTRLQATGSCLWGKNCTIRSGSHVHRATRKVCMRPSEQGLTLRAVQAREGFRGQGTLASRVAAGNGVHSHMGSSVSTPRAQVTPSKFWPP